MTVKSMGYYMWFVCTQIDKMTSLYTYSIGSKPCTLFIVAYALQLMQYGMSFKK